MSSDVLDHADLDAENIDRRAPREAGDGAGEVRNSRNLVLVAGGLGIFVGFV